MTITVLHFHQDPHILVCIKQRAFDPSMFLPLILLANSEPHIHFHHTIAHRSNIATMFDDNLFVLAPLHTEEEYLKYLHKPGKALVPARAFKSLRPVPPQRMTVFKEFVPGATEHDAYALYHTLKDIDIRTEPLYVRQRLLQGARYQLYINGQHVITAPHKLLQAAARFGVFDVSAGMVELPLDTHAGAGQILLRHLLHNANRADRPQRLR